MSRVGKKLEVKSFDEVYHPSITIVHGNTAGSSKVVEPLNLDKLKTTTVADAIAEIARSESDTVATPASVLTSMPAPMSASISAPISIPVPVSSPTPAPVPTSTLVQESTSQQEPAPKHAIEKTVGPKRIQRIAKRWCSGLSTIAVLLVALCAVALVGMRLAGFRTFTVMSGSMSPEYPVGALIYVQPIDYKSLKVGDVISYIANEDNTVVTHRITEITTDETDPSVLRFKTKGDANTSADAKLVHYKNVLGTPVITLPFIGYFAHNIQQPPGIYIALVVGTLLLAWTFLPSTLEERRKTARTSVT